MTIASALITPANHLLKGLRAVQVLEEVLQVVRRLVEALPDLGEVLHSHLRRPLMTLMTEDLFPRLISLMTLVMFHRHHHLRRRHLAMTVGTLWRRRHHHLEETAEDFRNFA